MHRDSLKSKVKEGARWYAQVFKQAGRDVIGSCCTFGIYGFKQPLDFCYRHSADCNKRTGLWGPRGIGQGLRLSVFATKDANVVVSSEVDTGRAV